MPWRAGHWPVSTPARLGEHNGLATLKPWKARPVVAESVEVRRADADAAGQREVALTEVVGDDQDDVRSGWSGWHARVDRARTTCRRPGERVEPWREG